MSFLGWETDRAHLRIPVERVHFSITCVYLPETTLLELLFAAPNMIFFFCPFSSAIGKFHSYGWGRTLAFLKACMHSGAKLSTSLESHCFLLSLCLVYFKLKSYLQAEGKRVMLFLEWLGRQRSLSLERATKGVHFRTLYGTWFSESEFDFECECVL